MQSSTPNEQCPHPNHSVQALKPLVKILRFDPAGRKPTLPLLGVAPQAWSIEVKYLCLGLIGAKLVDS